MKDIYFENSKIKKYSRTNKKNNEKKFFNQINLGYNSNFEDDEKICVIKEDDLKNLFNCESTKQDLKKEIQELKKKLSDNENKISEFEIKIDEYNSKCDSLYKELLHEKDLKTNIFFKYNQIINQIQNKWYFRLFGKLPRDLIEIEEKE